MASKFLQAIAKEALGALTNLKKTKDLPSGALNQLPVNIPIRPSQENMSNLLGANTYGGRVLGDETVDISTLSGGASVSARGNDNVRYIANQMRGPDGYIERIVVDQDGNVIEGAHRLDALRSLGISDVPITRIVDPTAKIDLVKMGAAIKGAGPIHSDHVNQIMSQVGDMLAEVSGDVGRVRAEFDFPQGFEKHFNAALDSMHPTSKPTVVDYLSKMNSCLEGNYSNCKLAVQQTLNNPELTGNRIRVSEDDAIVSDWFDKNSTKELEKNLRSGDILDFNQRHYAIYEGNGAVVQVPEWGAKPERISLSSVLEKWNPPTQIITELFEDGL